MSTHDLLVLLVGAALVCLGVLAGALADRIRGNRDVRRARAAAAPRASAGRASSRPDIEPVDQVAADARSGLMGLGYNARVAHFAVEEARAKVGPNADCETLTRAALRCCPKAVAA